MTYGLQFNKIKIIPYNIYDLLTPIALALWIMGDGVLKLKQSVELELRVMYRKVYCVAKGKF